MEQEFDRAQELIASYDDELRRLVPDGEIFDAHVHLGNDIDGMRGIYEELERSMERHDVSRAFMFCMDEPDRHPAFRAPNDRTLEYAKRSEGRLIPFVRLDLTESPIEEAERCLDLGARGIKLHPRAQRFMLNDERLAPVFALASERRVPILIHGGRGLPPISDHLARLVDNYPGAQLIIAHAGIADLAGLAGRFGGRAGVFFDTSVWSPVDLLSFFHLVASGAGAVRVRLPVRPSAELAPERGPHSARRRLRRRPAARPARGHRKPHRERRGPPAADRSRGRRNLQAADDPRAHPPVRLDGHAAPLDEPARLDRDHRARAERDRGAQRLPGGSRPHQGAADRRPRPLARLPGDRGRGPRRRRPRDAAPRPPCRHLRGDQRCRGSASTASSTSSTCRSGGRWPRRCARSSA